MCYVHKDCGIYLTHNAYSQETTVLPDTNLTGALQCGRRIFRISWGHGQKAYMLQIWNSLFELQLSGLTWPDFSSLMGCNWQFPYNRDWLDYKITINSEPLCMHLISNYSEVKDNLQKNGPILNYKAVA